MGSRNDTEKGTSTKTSPTSPKPSRVSALSTISGILPSTAPKVLEPQGKTKTFSLPAIIEFSTEGQPVLESLNNLNTTVVISSEGKELSTSGYYYYHASARSTVKVLGKSCWYYEVTIQNSGSARIGWSTPKWAPENQYSGLGADEESWGFDGSQQKKFHKNNNGEPFGQYWTMGDVIGTFVDFEQKRIGYTKNGTILGTAFQNIRVDCVIPSFSVTASTRLLVNFGRDFKDKPLGMNGLNPTIHENQVKSLEEIFKKYAQLGEDDEEHDEISGTGIVTLATDLGSTGATDPLVLILAWKLFCKVQWEISYNEWMCGWSLLGAFTLEQMKYTAQKWREEIKDKNVFKNFYAFIFGYLKAPQATVIDSKEALMAWRMCGLDQRWKLFDKWEAFWEETKIKGVNKDTWMMLDIFIETLGDGIENYNDEDCWPTAIDDFVVDLLKKDK